MERFAATFMLGATEARAAQVRRGGGSRVAGDRGNVGVGMLRGEAGECRVTGRLGAR